MAKKKTSLGCMFWIALLLLVLVVFFFNRERIMTVLEETGFQEYISREKPGEPEVKRISPLPEEPPVPPHTRDTVTIKTEEEEEEERQEEKTPDDGETGEGDRDTPELQTVEEGEEKPLIEKKMRKSAVYFVKLGDGESIELKKIIRPVYYADSPLTETLHTLLEGLTTEELNSGLLSLIPQNTTLNQIWIKDGVAFLDFSESLRFNQFGSEGLRAELQQIVYTATEFETVDAVQILINGRTIEYLSSEGIFIGRPLTREDVSTLM